MSKCQHHWVIELPNGARSRGICKRCQATKQFANAFDDLPPRDAPAPFIARPGHARSSRQLYFARR